MEYMNDDPHSNGDEMLTYVSRRQIDWVHCFVHVVLVVTFEVAGVLHFAYSWTGGDDDDDNVVVICC